MEIGAIILLILYFHTNNALNLDKCNLPLGMESGKIQDFDITSSSAYDSSSVGPQHARLKNNKNGGAWCPRHMVSRNSNEFLEISLENLHVLTETKTQGRYGNGQGQEYAEEYMLDYWRPGVNDWIRWKNRDGKKLLKGNTDTHTIIEQKLDPPIIATKIRFLPYSDHVRTVCMRVEIVGCKFKDGLLSYNMPQGSHQVKEFDLSDRTYDGREEAGHLSQGLGQLVDGRFGQDNFKLDLTGNGKGYEWVGWKNDSQTLEILFEFDKLRNFSAVHLHTNNYFSKAVQVFSHARTFFSTNSYIFDGEAVHFSYMPDLVLEHARNVTIKLHHRIGRWIKLQLYFASEWILLSEITFDSMPVTGNFTGTPENGSNLALPTEAERDFFPQRDEVKGNRKRHYHNNNNNNSSFSVIVPKSEGSKHHHFIGFVIGALSVVILVLVAGIVFIVFRSYYSPKISQCLLELPIEEDKPIENEKFSRDMLVSQSVSTKSTIDHQDESNFTNFQQEKHIIEPVLDFTEITEKTAQQPPLPPSSSTSFHESSYVQSSVIELFPRDQLRLIENIGQDEFSNVHLCEVIDNDYFKTKLENCKYVIVKMLRVTKFRNEFYKEVNDLCRLRNANVARLIGVCLESEPICAVREYTSQGDLYQFLQDHVAESATSLSSNVKTLSYDNLIHMATQIASGMKYLESIEFIHKDLATRNCLIGTKYSIKISDVGSYRQIYNSDYCRIVEGGRLLPIRWMAWESVIMDKFSSKSDVWSFAVTLWEILTFAREQPFEDLNDDKVMENVTRYCRNNGEPIVLDIPFNCPRDVYELMRECWRKNEKERPNFREIHSFLKGKNSQEQ